LKICTKCKQEKPKSEFYKDNRYTGGLYCWCKQCEREYIDQWRTTKKGKESRKKSNKKSNKTKNTQDYRKKYRNGREGKRANKRSQLKILYGMTIEEYEKMLKEQNGKCAICKSRNNNGNSLHVDHNHTTGKIRGLLCHKCNTALGIVNESKTILLSMISYLEKENN